MKNAMKKLMSVLLVAVLLISAVPFAASAASTYGLTVSVENGESKATTGAENESVTVKACAEFVGVDFSKVKGADVNGVWYNADAAFLMTAETKVVLWLNTAYTVYVDYGDGRYETCTITDGQAIGTSVLPAAPTSKGRQFTGWTWKDDGSSVSASEIAYQAMSGRTICANWNIVGCTECGQTDGHSANCSKYVKPSEPTTPSTPSDSTTASYVDVILVTNKTSGFTDGEYYRCYLVNGKITQADRDVVASKISGKNIVKWQRADNSTQADSLINFDFTGLKNPVNILPVVKTTGSTSSGSTSSGITNKDNTNQVWLHVYTNGNASTIAKSINLTSTYLMDDNSTNTTEIKNYLLTNYYKSSNSNKNIELDGLYVNLGNSGTFPQNYYTDNKVETLSNIDSKLNDGYVHINVMLKNVTAKTTTSATADSSNPKTGDSIYTAMTVMGISAASLAAVMYIYTKKRQAI